MLQPLPTGHVSFKKQENLRLALDDRTGHFFEPLIPEQLHKEFLFYPRNTLIAFTSSTLTLWRKPVFVLVHSKDNKIFMVLNAVYLATGIDTSPELDSRGGL